MTNLQKQVILFVSNDLSCDNRVHKVALSLTNAGFNVLVIGRRLRNSLSLESVQYARKRMRFMFNSGFLFYAEMNVRYFLFLLFHSFDIATANDLDTLPAVYWASRIKGRDCVYDSHEYFTEVPELVGRRRVQRVWQWIERQIFPNLRCCMTVCQSIADVYSEKYGVKVEVVRNVPNRCVTPVALAPIDVPQERVVLYQGALNMGRGLELLIDAMALVNNACLLLVGDGDCRNELQERARRNGMESSVRFVGRVDFKDLPSYTQLATIGVSLEENFGLNYRYALPNKLFDYIQAGKPVLVSDLPEMAAMVSHYGCGEIVYGRTPQLLAEQISNLLMDQKKLQTYSSNCSLAAQELCWEFEEQILLKLYQKNE